ncbi:MAG: hypothetical protein ABJN69_10730 [Hellea sp.]
MAVINQGNLHFKANRVRRILLDEEAITAEKILRDLEKRKSNNLIENDIRNILNDVLGLMAESITKALISWFEADDDSFKLYFWPGYQRKMTSNKRWVTHSKAEPELAKLLKQKNITHGTGRYVKRGQIENFDTSDFNVEWFNLLLRRSAGIHHSESVKQTMIEKPPSTHRWFDVDRRSFQVQTLGVEISERGSFNYDQDRYENSRMLQIGAPKEEVLFLSKNIRKLIFEAEQSAENSESAKWPRLWGTSKSFGEAENIFIKHVALLQYDFWLAGCFDAGKTITEEAVEKRLNLFRARLNKTTAFENLEFAGRIGAVEGHIREYSSALRNTLLSTSKRMNYESWYSIPVFSPIRHMVIGKNFHETPYLGTAMILCSKKINPVCLEVISSWVRSMYIALRGVEYAASAGGENTEHLTDAFSHEISKVQTDLAKKVTVAFSEVLTWPDNPFEFKNEIDDEARDFLSTTRLVTEPEALDSIGELLNIWGSFSIADWGINESYVSLRELIHALEPRAKKIAAVRKWSTGIPKARSMSQVLKNSTFYKLQLMGQATVEYSQNKSGYAIVLKSQILGPKVGLSEAEEDIKLQKSMGSIITFTRLLMAIVSNAMYHAETGFKILIKAKIIKAEATGSGQDELRISISNELSKKRVSIIRASKSLDSEDQKGGLFETKTDGVIKVCLDHLGGSLLENGANILARQYVTSLSIPIREHGDSYDWIYYEVVDNA